MTLKKKYFYPKKKKQGGVYKMLDVKINLDIISKINDEIEWETYELFDEIKIENNSISAALKLRICIGTCIESLYVKIKAKMRLSFDKITQKTYVKDISFEEEIYNEYDEYIEGAAFINFSKSQLLLLNNLIEDEEDNLKDYIYKLASKGLLFNIFTIDSGRLEELDLKFKVIKNKVTEAKNVRDKILKKYDFDNMPKDLKIQYENFRISKGVLFFNNNRVNDKNLLKYLICYKENGFNGTGFNFLKLIDKYDNIYQIDFTANENFYNIPKEIDEYYNFIKDKEFKEF